MSHPPKVDRSAMTSSQVLLVLQRGHRSLALIPLQFIEDS
jgi:hypothetical protein